eukprot:TRINITY_DN57970_c0_g1_i2.p1 TRINITY_DN57970_c0_g1~~TRINITY_DN57970_c0_g1_i2.p1  ORF type:complete len:556 (+),score=33.35 TRINITY_DN57970_c0_g1_i2:29-1696(+)
MRLSSKLVRFNVGGRIFQTTKNTLTKVSNSLLATLAETDLSSAQRNLSVSTKQGQGQLCVHTDTDGTIFLDRNSRCFEVMLAALQSAQPIKVSDPTLRDMIRTELEFFEIPQDVVLADVEMKEEKSPIEQWQKFLKVAKQLEGEHEQGTYEVASCPSKQLIAMESAKWPKISAELERALQGTFVRTIKDALWRNKRFEILDEHGTAVALFPLCDSLEEADVQRLLSHSTPALFGHGEDTVFDPDVRVANQIGPTRWRMDSNDDSSGWPEIQWLLGLHCDFKLIPHSINVYSEGGHFGWHKDAVHSPGQVATLVVCLPSQFSGGELVVRHRGKTEVFTFNYGQSKTLEAVAFFSDCEHKINQVTGGHRVTLSFDICIEASRCWWDYPCVYYEEAEYSNEIQEELKTVLRRIVGQDDGVESFGFMLMHEYPISQLLSPSFLKEGDKMLYDTVMEVFGNKSEYEVTLKPLMVYQGQLDENYSPPVVYEPADFFGKEEPAQEEAPNPPNSRPKRVLLGPVAGSVAESTIFGEGYHGNESGSSYHWYTPTIVSIRGNPRR